MRTSMLWVSAGWAWPHISASPTALGCALSFSFFFLPLCCCAFRRFTNCLSWLT